MSDNVFEFNGVTKLDQPAVKILEAAKAANLEWVVIVGRTPEGELYFAGNHSDVANVNLMLD